MRKDIGHFADAIRAYGLDPNRCMTAAWPRPSDCSRPTPGADLQPPGPTRRSQARTAASAPLRRSVYSPSPPLSK
jgi:hypothetical protein